MNNLGIDKNIVSLQSHNENWSAEFKKEKAILQGLLKGYEVQLAHVGSTAIKGLSAKPIIDVALGVDSVETIKAVAEVLAINGYYTKCNLADRGCIFIAKENMPNSRTHHIHLSIVGSARWNEQVYFKKYLLEHPEIIAEYENLKKDFATKHANNRTEYTSAKDVFIKSILEKAYIFYGVK